MQVIRLHEHGGPEVLQLEDRSVPIPVTGEVLVRQEAIGLNFIDTYHRSGLYAMDLPGTPGVEAAGIVEAVGEGVIDVRVGDRVAYAGGAPGAYAEYRAVPAGRVVKLPDDISFETAASALLKGLTAEYLLRRTYPVKPGDFVLIHAAAGGVGLLACQWAKVLGATVIGTVSTAEKARLARSHGCDHVLILDDSDFSQQVRQLSDGQGVAVVYDGVGQATFARSINSLRPRGTMVCFGNASGPVPPVDPLLLSGKGSLFLTRPTLAHYTATREELDTAAGALFEVIRGGRVKVEVKQHYSLRDAAQAHRDLEARRTAGSSLLLPPSAN